LKLTTHLHLVPKSRMVEPYLHLSIYLHVIVLNFLSTMTTLLLPFTFPFLIEFVRNVSELDTHSIEQANASSNNSDVNL
jgi:hypothetical protein